MSPRAEPSVIYFTGDDAGTCDDRVIFVIGVSGWTSSVHTSEGRADEGPVAKDSVSIGSGATGVGLVSEVACVAI